MTANESISWWKMILFTVAIAILLGGAAILLGSPSNSGPTTGGQLGPAVVSTPSP